MSIEQEDGEVIENHGLQEFHRISNSLQNVQQQGFSDGNKQGNEDKWMNLSSKPFYIIAQEAYKELKVREERANRLFPEMPVLPILPTPISNNYEWKTWSNWYQNLCDGEKRLMNSEVKRSFSLIVTRIPNSYDINACLLASNNYVVFDSCIECPQQFYPILHLIPILEGVVFSRNQSRITFDQLKLQLGNALSSIPTLLLVYSLSLEIQNALGLNQISSIIIRDLDRFPLHTPSTYIPRVIHDLFVTPSTPITILNPFAALMQYLNKLCFTIKWVDIPIPSHNTIKWVRYSIFYKQYCMLTGYCIVPSNDNSKQRAAFAVLRHLWGIPCPMLYEGEPSREEMEKLDKFIQCVCGNIKYTIPQVAALLVPLYHTYEKEFNYCLTQFAPQKKEEVTPPPQPISMPTPQPIELTTDDIQSSKGIKRSSEEISTTTTTQQVISLPDLTFSSIPTDENARLILIVDIDLTIIHAIHDEESIQRFNLWLDEKSSSVLENDWKQALRLQLEAIDLSYIDDNGNNRSSNLLLKIRPGVPEFLSTLAQYFELIIYTQGEEQYAQQVIKILDPQDQYFKGRYIARQESIEPQKKALSRILDCWNRTMKSPIDLSQLCNRLLIIDDKEDVWEASFHEQSLLDPINCIIKCFPYFFFNTKTDSYSYNHLKQYDDIEKEYMKRLVSIFVELATNYYQNHMDIRMVLRKQKRQVLRGLRVAFTSIIERSEQLEKNVLYKSLIEFGGVYVQSIEKDCDLLVCRNVRTAKVNQAQEARIPVVSVRWLEECVKYWKLASLDPYYMEFAQDANQTAIMGKAAIIVYHQKAKNLANTSLFTVTEPPPAYNALLDTNEKQVLLKDFDDEILNEMESFDEKRSKISEKDKNQFSPSVNVVLAPS